MIEFEAVLALDALAHAQRLRVFRALVAAGPEGLLPSTLADELVISRSALSFHLKTLHHAGLVTTETSGRNVIYRAEFEKMTGLIAYLTENCCGGAPCDLNPGACDGATGASRCKS